MRWRWSGLVFQLFHHEEGWDQPPRLFSLHRHFVEQGDVPGFNVTTNSGMIIYLVAMPFPHQLDREQIAAYLSHIARRIKTKKITFDNLFGFLFISEAWMRSVD